MRIVELETFGRGGLTHYTFNLSRALAERGHEVVLVTTLGWELEGTDCPEGLQIEKRIAAWTQGPRAARIPRALLPWVRRLEALLDAVSTARWARGQKPDAIHLHCTNSIALVYLGLFRLLRLPVVATAHQVTPHEAMPLQRSVYRRIHHWPQRVIAHSEVDRARLADEFDLDPTRVVVIPHGEYGFFRDEEGPGRAASRASLGLSEDDEVALFFGYIREYKGLDLLLEAWPRVLATRPRARFLIAGDPVQLPENRRRELEAWAERLGAVHRFEYVPFEDVSRHLVAADVMVMPYRRISQSGVLYLALGFGLPVLATAVGGLAEALEDGVSARLIPPEDPDALAESLIDLLGRPELRARLAEGGRALAEDHSWPRVAERTEAVFEQV